MFERITNAFAVVRTLLSVLWIRAYRLVDNLLTGSPAWGRSPARRATAARLRIHRLVRPNVATD